MVSDPVAIKKQLLALKFLDDIKIEREKKRRREREKRRKEITKKIGEKSNSTTEQQVEASSGIYKNYLITGGRWKYKNFAHRPRSSD